MELWTNNKHKLFGADLLRTFLTLTAGCTGIKKFLPIISAAGKCTFGCGRPRFLAWTSMTRRVLEKLCTKMFALISWPLDESKFPFGAEGLGWHVCKTKLPQISFIPKETSYRKLENCDEASPKSQGSDGHRTRLSLGKGRRRTSKKFCAFLDGHFCLVLRY